MKRKNKTSLLKNIFKTLPVLLGVVVVFYAALFLKNIEVPTVLPVKNVQVPGEMYFLDKEAVKLTVKNNISGGYFTVDLNNVREILLQEPWIKNVSLRRQWPASLDVLIDEQVPVAYWNNDGYISEKGDVFKPVFIDKELNLPNLNGPEGQHNNVWKFMNTLYKETALLNYEVVRLKLDDRRAWQLVIAGHYGEENAQIEVKLGRFDTEKRMQRFVSILPALTIKNGLLGNNIKVIDMRYPNGFAVQMTDRQMIEKTNSQTEKFPHNIVYEHHHATVQRREA